MVPFLLKKRPYSYILKDTGGGNFMAIKTKLSIDDRDELTKDVDDLDKAYLERMKKEGIDPELLEQFRDLTLELDKQDK